MWVWILATVTFVGRRRMSNYDSIEAETTYTLVLLTYSERRRVFSRHNVVSNVHIAYMHLKYGDVCENVAGYRRLITARGTFGDASAGH